MKRMLFFVMAVMAAAGFTSCDEEELPRMIWEFDNYDKTVVSANYKPEYMYMVQIVAPEEYQGEITLMCTNYRQLTVVPGYTSDPADNEVAGYSVSKIDDTTLKVTFSPVKFADENGISDVFSVEGKNGKNISYTNIEIRRIKP